MLMFVGDYSGGVRALGPGVAVGVHGRARGRMRRCGQTSRADRHLFYFFLYLSENYLSEK